MLREEIDRLQQEQAELTARWEAEKAKLEEIVQLKRQLKLAALDNGDSSEAAAALRTEMEEQARMMEEVGRFELPNPMYVLEHYYHHPGHSMTTHIRHPPTYITALSR